MTATTKESSRQMAEYQIKRLLHSKENHQQGLYTAHKREKTYVNYLAKDSSAEHKRNWTQQ